MKILMVCLGNICRSPMAHGLMEEKIGNHQLNWQVDSAGTSSFHQGEAPDTRAIACMEKHGIDISAQQSRPFRKNDFEDFDLIFCMDKINLRNVLLLAQHKEHAARAKLILHEIEDELTEEVPDPYYDSYNGFEHVFALLNKATDAIIKNYTNAQ